MSDDSVIKLKQSDQHLNLRYQIAYKTVGNAEFFNDENVRHTIDDCLDQYAIKVQVRLSNVEIFNDGLTFEIETPVQLNLKRFLMRAAQLIINDVNREYPNLQLKQMAPGGVLSRLWHRPYYILTLPTIGQMSLEDYLK